MARPKGPYGTTDFLKYVSRARLRGWVQEDYPEGNGIKLVKKQLVELPPAALGPGTHTVIRILYLIFFENTIVAYRIREDLSPTVRAPRATACTRGRAIEYLETFGEDPIGGTS